MSSTVQTQTVDILTRNWLIALSANCVLQGQLAQELTCTQLHKKAERIANALLDKDQVNVGSHVALLFHAGVELVCGFFGALYAGCVPLAVRPPTSESLAASLATCRMVIELSKSSLILTTAPIIKLLKSKACALDENSVHSVHSLSTW